MVISRKSALKSLSVKKKNCSFRASGEIFKRLGIACEMDGFKTYSPVLVNLMQQLVDRVGEGLEVKSLPATKKEDNASLSVMCPPELFETFTKVSKKLGSRPLVFDLIASDYIKQAEKHHGVKIEV